MKLPFRCIAAALALLLMSGCGVKTAYNNADWLLMRWIEERVSLTDEQRTEVRESLAGHLAWHCRNELPEYLRFLREVGNDVAAGRISEPVLEGYRERAADFGERILSRVRPSLAQLLAGLSDSQVAELLASLAERDEVLAEESGLTTDELEARRIEAMTRAMRRFAGRPTRAQREHLGTWAGQLQPTAALVLGQRRSWQADFAAALSIRHERKAFEEALDGLLQPGTTAQPELALRQEENRRKTIATLVALHRQAPPRQVAHLLERLEDFSDDLAQVACR